MQCALDVVFLGDRYAERRHHRVAGELLDRAAGAGHFFSHRVVEPVEHRPRLLGVLGAAELRRADEIGEEHRRELALGVLWISRFVFARHRVLA